MRVCWIAPGLVWTIFFGVSCSSSRESRLDPVPMHAVVLSSQVVPVGASSGVEQGMPIGIDRVSLDRAIVQELEGRPFVRVSLTNESLDEVLEVARDQGVDVILQARVEHNPFVDSGELSSSWSVWALYFFGLWFNWSADNRSYEATGTIKVSVYQPQLGTTARRPLDAVLVSERTMQLDPVKMDFLDRAENVVDYLLTFVLPAAYLQGDSESANTTLREKIVAMVAQKIAGTLTSGAGRRELEEGKEESVPPFQLRGGRIERGKTGVARVMGEIWLRRGTRVERMTDWKLCHGDLTRNGTWDGPSQESNDGEWDIYDLDEEFHVSEGQPFVWLEIVGGTQQRLRRSYTLRLREGLETK